MKSHPGHGQVNDSTTGIYLFIFRHKVNGFPLYCDKQCEAHSLGQLRSISLANGQPGTDIHLYLKVTHCSFNNTNTPHRRTSETVPASWKSTL